MIKYNINNLVVVSLSKKVRTEIFKEVDIMLSHFRDDACITKSDYSSIRIFTFDEFNQKEKLDVSFYEYEGIRGKGFVDYSRQLAITFSNNKIEIYANHPNFLINPMIQLIIVQQGYTLIHAAGFKNSNGKATLITGAGGIGKTATIAHVVENLNLKYLGDDLVIIGEKGNCLPCPRSFVLKSYHRDAYSETFKRMKLPRWNTYKYSSKIKKFILENAPFVGISKKLLFNTNMYTSVANIFRPKEYIAAVKPEQVFGDRTVAKNVKIGNIVSLERSTKNQLKVEGIPQEIMANELFSIIHHEWELFIYQYMCLGAIGVIDTVEYFENVIAIIENVIKEAQISKVIVPNNYSPDQLMELFEREKYF